MTLIWVRDGPRASYMQVSGSAWLLAYSRTNLIKQGKNDSGGKIARSVEHWNDNPRVSYSNPGTDIQYLFSPM